MLDKKTIRKRMWQRLEKAGVARFPKPIIGRIPNFEGSERAAQRLLEHPRFQRATVVKVNPDSPQATIRRGVLSARKRLIMPSPRLRKGFLLLDPHNISKVNLRRASTIRGAFKYGRFCPLSALPRVDLIVAGSVAVTRTGVRVGKGGGYSELEYGILRALALVDEDTPIFTTVHDRQIIKTAPKEEHDFVVDAIFTPTTSIQIQRQTLQPSSILWDHLTPHQIAEIPILTELKRHLKSNSFQN